MVHRQRMGRGVKSRFEGEEGRRRALDVLLDNPAVRGHRSLAEALLAVADTREHAAGDVLVTQDGPGTELAFLLAGEVEVRVNRRLVAIRSAPAHVGEMAAIDPKADRSATVLARKTTVAAWIAEPQLTRIATEFPELWRGFARVLADRLRERRAFHRAPNERPRAFIGSSVEGLQAARALRVEMDHDPIDLHAWPERTFRPSHYTLPDLLSEVDACDFAIFCLTGDDEVTSRGGTASVPRDNVLFEIGLFVGRLGHERVLLLRPRGVALKLPSDLDGLGAIEFVAGERPDLAVAAERVRWVVAEVGVR